MLRKINEDLWREYVNYAYELSLQPEKTSYPVYYDGIKTKEDFIRRTEKSSSIEDEEILLYEDEEKICGWIHFYYLKEDNYLSTVSMSFSAHMERGLEEFLAYVTDKYPGCEIWLGFPEENRQALSWLAKQGFKREEESYNDILFLDNYQAGETPDGIVRITEENFPLFAGLHSQFDSDMYWNSERMRRRLDQWMIFLYEKGNAPQGAIYCAKWGIAEIFGVDFAGGIYNQEAFCALTEAVLNACKAGKVKHLIFSTIRKVRPMRWLAGLNAWESISSWSKGRGMKWRNSRQCHRHGYFFIDFKRKPLQNKNWYATLEAMAMTKK
ncbi:MAG: hypothetical protein K2O34_02045 [Acetatifactor sp.]|nr:hypothetical protein [Acetatifactor sp.]